MRRRPNEGCLNVACANGLSNSFFFADVVVYTIFWGAGKARTGCRLFLVALVRTLGQ